MIDKRVKSYIRTRNGQAFFQYVERFDSVKKAADPSNEGELVEVKVSDIKWDFTKVKEDADGKHQKSSAKTDGQTKEEK
tara:strand:+ start:525 stop:761 length:237 start_codon:yes stop_codon:yes gene_type:complete